MNERPAYSEEHEAKAAAARAAASVPGLDWCQKMNIGRAIFGLLGIVDLI